MSEWLLYLKLGLWHILDVEGYDHMLYLVALAAAFQMAQWMQLALTATAFTLGHSLSLGLVVSGRLPPGGATVEILIALSILATALLNLISGKSDGPSWNSWVRYFLAMGFGLVHGFGFSRYLRSLIGGEESIVGPLVGFNLGIECAQLLVLAVVMVLSTIALRIGLRPRYWCVGLSVFAATLSIVMLLQRI